MRKYYSTALQLVRGQAPTLLMLISLCVFFACSTNGFMTWKNFMNILIQISPMAILGIGLTFILIGGNFDLSGGSVLALIGVLCAQMLTHGIPVSLTIFAAISMGGLIGLFNGICVTYLKLASFIITLATSIMAKGLALASNGGRTIYGLPNSFNVWGAGKIGSIPVTIILLLTLFVVFYIVLAKTVFGHQVYAVGENKKFATTAGIRTSKVIIATYVLAGCLYAVAGIVLTGRLSAAVSTNGIGLEMNTLAAVAIGGISMFGGRGDLLGTFIGCLIMGVLSNGLNLMNISPYYTDFIRGFVIFLVLALDVRIHITSVNVTKKGMGDV